MQNQPTFTLFSASEDLYVIT